MGEAVHLVAKRCSKCGETKALDQFHTASTKRGGLATSCKACVKAYHQSKSPVEVTVIERRCTDCSQVKLASEFSIRRASFDGLTSRCRHCINRDRLSKYERTRLEIARFSADGSLLEKRCARCDTWKAPGQFHVGPEHGTQTYCKSCRMELHKQALYKVDINEMWRSQKGMCGVCGRSMEWGRGFHGVVVDHDHGCCPGGASCGKCVRGLLHSSCNRVLGSAKDDPSVLDGAAAYLRAWKAGH